MYVGTTTGVLDRAAKPPSNRYRAVHVAHPATKERHSHVPRKGKGK